MSSPLLLLVEGDGNDEELIRMALRSRPEVRLIVARDEPSAMALLLGSGSPQGYPELLPWAVLLDANLSKFGGMEVLRQIRSHARTRFLPVVVLGSSSEEADLLAAYQAGANSYVVKPIASQQFAGVIVQLAQYWLRLNQFVQA